MGKKITTFFIALILLLGFSACSKEADKSADAGTSETISEAVNETEKETTKTTGKSDSKTAVIYFSATGTTKDVAEIIARETGASVFEIIPKEPYTSDDLSYNNDSCRANREQNDSSARPEIANDLGEIKEYDKIYLGYPIWWGTNPKIINTFLDFYDLSGAQIHLFCTSGSSGIDRSVSELQSAYPNLKIADGKRFESGAVEAIKGWIAENK